MIKVSELKSKQRMVEERRVRINVVGLGARDYYHVAAALDAGGQLGKLITDFYTPNFLRGTIRNRFHPDLDSSRTIHFPIFYLFQILARRFLSTDLARKTQRVLLDRAFGFLSAAITYMGCGRAIVYSYYLEGFVLFYKVIGRRPVDLICFQVHPTSPYVKRQLDKDRALFQSLNGVSDFIVEPEQDQDEEDIASYKDALAYCSKFICASSASVRSVELLWPLLPSIVIPYGSKLQACNTVAIRCSEKHYPIRLITVCQLVQRKGMHWAFAAMSSLPKDIQLRFQWVIVSNAVDNSIVDMAPDNVKFLSLLSDNEIASELANADLFVMPSLIEGFGLVYIESLSVGTPVMYTAETGAADICTSGVHGFEVACSNWQQIADLFCDLAENPAKLHGMRQQCADLATEISWDQFHRKLRAACSESQFLPNN